MWETDHVQAPVLVDAEGTAQRTWITWFTDCATNAITGVAVTPGYTSRESVPAALRPAILREDPYRPFGGLPEKVRVDRGKDFLSRTVTAAFDLLDVGVEDIAAFPCKRLASPGLGAGPMQSISPSDQRLGSHPRTEIRPC